MGLGDFSVEKNFQFALIESELWPFIWEHAIAY